MSNLPYSTASSGDRAMAETQKIRKAVMQLQSPTKASGLKDLTDQLEFDFAGPNEKMLKKAFVAGYSAGEDDRPGS